MQVYKSSLKEYLAEEILSEIYSKKKVAKKVNKMQGINCNYTSTEEVLRTYARAFQSELNKKAALIVLESLNKEKKMLLRLKYGEEKHLVAISFALNMSVGQLVKWNQSIIAKVANFMEYRLMEEDVFCKKNIVRMIELLSKSIEFFTMLSTQVEIRRDWLEEMKRRKNNYDRLLERIERLENEGKKNSFSTVVITKIKNPEQPLVCIAEFCKLNQSVVSRYLKRFANSVKVYLT